MDVKATKIIEAAKELLKLYGYFVDNLWHVDDIHFLCEQQGLPQLENAEAMEIFTIAREQFDGENGLSWPTLESAIYAYLQRKALLSLLREMGANEG